MTPADPDAVEGEGGALFADAMRRVAGGGMEIAALVYHATRLQERGQLAYAAELYKRWIALNADHPLLHIVCFNYAVGLTQDRRSCGCDSGIARGHPTET